MTYVFLCTDVPSTQQGFQNQAFNQQYPQQTQGFQYAPQTQGYPGQANQFPDQGFQVGQTYPNQQTGFMSQGYSNQQGVGAEQGYAAPQSYPDGYQAANYQNQFGNQVPTTFVFSNFVIFQEVRVTGTVNILKIFI